MSIAITSIGVKVSYAVEVTAGTRPTTGFKHIPEIKSIPSMSSAPDTLETTSLDNLEYKTYTNGLKDLGGSLEFTANFTQELFDLWNKEIMTKYATAKTAGLQLYMAIEIPNIVEVSYFTFEPSPIGLPEAGVNQVLEATLSVTPTGEPIWAAKPTYVTL